MHINCDENCKIGYKLEQIHAWAHAILGDVSKEQLHQAHEIGHKILDMINEEKAINPVKFLAMIEVLSVGADVLERDVDFLQNNLGGTATIN